MDASDWRSELQPHARRRAVQQIMNAVKRYNLLDDDGMQELEKFSQSFEKKTFAGATSQSEYLQIITSKEASIKRKMQEGTYQKIVMLKGMYLPELKEMYQKVVNGIQQQAESDNFKYEKMKIFKAILDRLIGFLQISESNISPALTEKLLSYEKQIINFIYTNRRKEAKFPTATLVLEHHLVASQHNSVLQF